MAIFSSFSNLQKRKLLSGLFLTALIIPLTPTLAQDGGRTSTYEPPQMFGTPPPAQPRNNGGYVLKPGMSSPQAPQQYVRPSVKGKISSPDDAQLDEEYKPYIPNFGAAPMAPEPIDQSPAARGIEVQSVITPPAPLVKPAPPAMAVAPELPTDETVLQEPPAAPVIEAPVIEAPVVEGIAPPEVPAPEALADSVEEPPETMVNPAVPEKPEKPAGVVKGPKTMPAAPATGVAAEVTEEPESALQDGDLMKRHTQEQEAKQEDISESAAPASIPSSFEAAEGEDKTQKLMVFEKGQTDMSPEDITFLQTELAAFLKASPAAQLEVVGFASADPGDPNADKRIALSRVMSVRSVLMNEGVAPEQLNLRAMGSKTDKTPADRIDLYIK